MRGAGALFAPGDVDGVRRAARARARRRRSCAPSSTRAGLARADRAHLGSLRPKATADAYARAARAAGFVDSARARPARRLGRPRPTGRRRRVHDRDRARARRRAPTSTCTSSTRRGDDAALARRSRPAPRCTRSRPNRRPARLVWEQTAGPRVARPAPSRRLARRRTTRCRCARTVPTVVAMHDLTFFDHPEWHERSKVVYFRRMIAAAAHARRRRSSPAATTRPTACARASTRRARSSSCHHGVDHDRFAPDGRRRRRPRRCSRRARHHARRTSRSRARIEPRKDVPDARARVRADRAAASRRAARPRGRRRMGRRPRRAPRSRRAASRRASCAPVTSTTRRSPRSSAGPRSIAYPSLDEGFGMPALEALASGAPLVTTSGSALEEVVGDAALLVPPADVDALAGALAPIARRPALAARLRAAGPARAAHVHVGAFGRRARRRVPPGDRARAVAPDESARHRRDRFRRPASRRAPPRVAATRSSRPATRRGAFDITDRDGVHDVLAAAPARGRVPPRGAGPTSAASWRDPTACLRVNVEGTANVLDAARACGARRVLVVGSAEEYGQVDAGPTPRSREDAPLRPITPYGASKVAASFLALQAWLGARARDRSASARSRTRARASPIASSSPRSRAASSSAEHDGRDDDRGRRARPRPRPLRRARRRARVPAARWSTASRARSTTCAAVSASSIGEIADRLARARRRPARASRSTPRSCARSTSRGSSATRRKLVAATGWQPRATRSTRRSTRSSPTRAPRAQGS